MKNKFIYILFLTFFCAFPCASVTTKITRLLLDNKQIIFLHDYHLPDQESVAQTDILIDFIEKCKNARINLNVLLEQTSHAAEETQAKMSLSTITQSPTFQAERRQILQRSQPKSETESVEISGLIDSLKGCGTAADWRVPFFVLSVRTINQLHLLKSLGEINSVLCSEQGNGLDLFLEYLDTLEQKLLQTLSGNTLTKDKEREIQYNDKPIQFGRRDHLVVNFLLNLNTVIRPAYRAVLDRPLGFIATINYIRNNYEAFAKTTEDFLVRNVADVGFYVEILTALQQNDIVILVAGEAHCSCLVERFLGIGATELPGVIGLEKKHIDERLEMRRLINLNPEQWSKDDFEKIKIAVETDDFLNLFDKAFDFKNKSENKCSVCDKSGKLLVCSRCKNKFYCSKSCQTTDWSVHKGDCKQH